MKLSPEPSSKDKYTNKHISIKMKANYQDYIKQYPNLPKFSIASLHYDETEEISLMQEIEWEIGQINKTDGDITMSVYGNDDEGDEFYAGELSISFICSPALASYTYPGRDYDPRDGYSQSQPSVDYLVIELESVNGNKYPVTKDIYDKIYDMLYTHFAQNPESEED